MDTKDWGTFDTQLGKVRDAVKLLTADLGPSPKLADVRERGRRSNGSPMSSAASHSLGAGLTVRHDAYEQDQCDAERSATRGEDQGGGRAPVVAQHLPEPDVE